ncbi:diguanylate cyclase (GGDEF)-like protein [Brevundimonas vesicularis]|uniref:Diguanylate cyclase (GGDEF)-like protein n=1 Tax=Brevundimonas vesicularis TaxID=41276 RepID=A0A7W9FUM8_BREVE|nr:bifunctional diguanylate cyclase/phosphodiesterase [Brevundimonas vesicularis]MBB5771887.1 diguanylate cyclase (GGDEF)-like protein [Brevundimonas vesicularis]
MRFFTCLTDDHNLWLVALAAGLCLIGSIITFRLYRRLRAAEKGTRLAWAFMGAVATGATIWCTHFVAMIAYEPGVTISYGPVLTGLSLGVAIAGSALALWVASRGMRASAEIGGVLFGLTVVAMHYTGMAAFATDAVIHWSAAYVAASVAGAVFLGALAFNRARQSGKIVPVVLMVLGIVALHFTGMAAMTIVPVGALVDMGAIGSTNLVLAFAVSAVGLMMLGTGVASHALDVQSRLQAKARLDHLIEGSVDGMVVEQDGVILAANAAFADLAGVQHQALVGEPLSRWVSGVADLAVNGLSQSKLVAEGGADIPVEIAVRRDCGMDHVMIYAVRDLRMRQAQERRIAHLARNDGLTGLPNRSSFLEWLTRQTADLTVSNKVALLAMDLDRFKEVNDVHGHAAGDQLLIQIAERMRACLRHDEFIARLGGDEFVAVVPIQHKDDALDLVARLRHAVTAPVVLDHAEVACGLSTGIAIWPDDAHDPSALINDADLAMYRAKASLGTDVCFYEEEMDEAVRNRRRMAQQMREALDQGQFSLNWQLQAAVDTGDITGYEVLLRWIQPDGTFISPADFIPLAEENGLILPIGEWVLRTACAEAASWTEPHKIAVNLSPVQLGHVDLPRLVHQVLVETGLSPSRLELEITETAMITDMERTTHVLRQLKLLGVSIAMDDFGTGYSSLSTLRAFPFDKIKLDRSFMSELDGGPQSAAIIRAVLALGESLHIPVLAEGVETLEQLSFLRDQGCDEVQGYLLGRPQKTADAEVQAAARVLWAVDPALERAA